MLGNQFVGTVSSCPCSIFSTQREPNYSKKYDVCRYPREKYSFCIAEIQRTTTTLCVCASTRRVQKFSDFCRYPGEKIRFLLQRSRKRRPLFVYVRLQKGVQMCTDFCRYLRKNSRFLYCRDILAGADNKI